jgi:hypothetical protein
MLDILLLAFWTDTTRIATFMFGNAQTGRNFSFLDGVKGGFHQLSHHKEQPHDRDQYEKIGTWHITQMARLLEKMKHLDEGGSSLLDNSMLLFGGSIKDGNSHDHHNLPLVLAGKAGGALRPGRRVRAPQDTPFCNLFVNVLNIMGIDEKKFGDSTGPLKGLS